MLWTRTLIPTMKETPEGAEIPSHILMLRAGLISQVMAGAYSYLPLGWRALRKAEQIVREEMDAAGAVELHMSALAPISLYEQTGRVEAFGNVLIKADLPRGGKKVPVVFCPTHEETITDIVSRYVASWRQLPITLYQIQTKFRNEERPRFGVLRTSEFLMKDAYSFDTSIESLNRSYDAMYAAYCRIFTRCGVPYLPVEAESGPIGGDASHEFMFPSANGEDKVVHCPCGYAANTEKAEIGAQDTQISTAEQKPLTEIATPGSHTVEQVCAFLSATSAMIPCKPHKLVKTLIYIVDGKPIAVLVRGDHDANENKLRKLLKADKVELAEPSVIERATGAPVGFAGPVGLKEKLPIFADHAVASLANVVTGANKAETHLVNVNLERDFTVDQFADLRNAGDGDPCPRCSSVLKISNAIEGGHVFKLGTKYSEALGAKFLDTDETQKTIIMGCYGIGVNRILVGVCETSIDESGIIWPVALAPYEVIITPLKTDEASMAVANNLCEQLEKLGVDCLIDDRDQRAGVKFKDADLIGCPLRIVIGPKGLENGEVEVKWRWDKDATMRPLDTAAATLADELANERRTNQRFSERKKSESSAKEPNFMR